MGVKQEKREEKVCSIEQKKCAGKYLYFSKKIRYRRCYERYKCRNEQCRKEHINSKFSVDSEK